MMFEGSRDGNLGKNGKCHAEINGVLWHGRVVRRDDDNVLKKALMLEVNRQQN